MIGFVCLWLSLFTPMLKDSINPIKIGVAGLSHDHVNWVFNDDHKKDVQIVGIAESDTALARKYVDRYGLSLDLIYSDLEEMVKVTAPQAVMAFGSIYSHLEVVRVCAPRGIHVMVEKPLAVSLNHAREIEQLARTHNIHVLTNYETTWYPSNHKVYQVVNELQELGTVRKIVVHDGHRGPVEIGCSEEFLAWLTDPELNGGGAIVDFGCYGANLATWLMNNQKPTAVWGITQQQKPHIYPEVDDEATIVLEYPGSQVIIQASWNWPFSRKDMKIYGENGSIEAMNARTIHKRIRDSSPEDPVELPHLTATHQNPFSYLAAVVRGEIIVKPGDLSSLENNMIVVEILDAARYSAQTGQKVIIK